MPRRTFSYTRVLGKIRVHANFVRAAKLDRIKMLIDEDPNYANDVLPYIWAMGMLNEWSELLDRYSLAAGPPRWYEDHRENAEFSYQDMTESLKRSFGYSEKENK